MNETQPFLECPRYDRCSVNHCPLDPLQSDREPHPGDKEPVCTMEKGVRARIGSKYLDLLPLGGLTPREHAGARKWANLTTAQRREAKSRLEQARKLSPVGNKPKMP